MRSFVVALLVISTTSHAQDNNEAAIMRVVDGFFQSITERDTTTMAELMIPSGVFHAVPWGASEFDVQPISFKRYYGDIMRGKERLLERYWDPVVRIEDRIATVWMEYDFHVDGTLSHCGFNVLNMVQTISGWRIASGVFNMRMEDCPESPLGPVE